MRLFMITFVLVLLVASSSAFVRSFTRTRIGPAGGIRQFTTTVRRPGFGGGGFGGGFGPRAVGRMLGGLITGVGKR
ncbi:unnamed protein product, partial [Mesorhabditis belari]|uniref:Uncharacterized protein n=1 Tax=Mesorhabditis belari TaxID=2138241 RepID=A0AAF3EKB7_9BILA